MYLETERLIVTDFTEDMAMDVHLNSLDEDNRSTAARKAPMCIPF